MSVELAGTLILKLIGAATGAFLALVFLPPKSVREFLFRSGGTLVAGIIFAPQTAWYLNWVASDETTLSSASAAAFISWWGMGAAVRVATLFKAAAEVKAKE